MGFLHLSTMNKIFTPVLLLAIFLNSCQNQNTTANSENDTILYQSDSLGFSMEYPISFEAVENINPYVPVGFFEKFKDSTSDYYRENVMVNIETLPVEVNYNEYVQAGKTQLKLMIPDVKIYDEDSLLINDHKCATYKFYIKKDSVDFVSKMYVIPLKDKAYQFSCTSNSATFDAYEDLFTEMIKSVKIK